MRLLLFALSQLLLGLAGHVAGMVIAGFWATYACELLPFWPKSDGAFGACTLGAGLGLRIIAVTGLLGVAIGVSLASFCWKTGIGFFSALVGAIGGGLLSWLLIDVGRGDIISVVIPIPTIGAMLGHALAARFSTSASYRRAPRRSRLGGTA